jgi:hypothetical protein
MGGFANSPAGGPSSGVTLDSPPSRPPGQSQSTLGWATNPEGGMGAEASNPQIMALQGTKLIEMGVQVLSAALPTLAAVLQQFVQQLQQVVPQAMSQAMGGGIAGTPMGAPSPVPTPPGAPQGMPGGGGGAAM